MSFIQIMNTSQNGLQTSHRNSLEKEIEVSLKWRINNQQTTRYDKTPRDEVVLIAIYAAYSNTLLPEFQNYNLLPTNCEHSVKWCFHGEEESLQVLPLSCLELSEKQSLRTSPRNNLEKKIEVSLKWRINNQQTTGYDARPKEEVDLIAIFAAYSNTPLPQF
ncbi:hypothetical protein QYM36_015143 [Artemia franciscana]|uniref:LRAT domain-containing protein n=1 Tax=Artemia franciscana TaxID=6661 RepID=A0AA88L4A7_ARTSF|nr:hypothetical protein QYM36_015143 [Artemia franciscana]